MNLTSCDGCGVVLDKDKLKFPEGDEMYDKYGETDHTKAVWYNDRIVPFVPCPVCGESILKSQ